MSSNTIHATAVIKFDTTKLVLLLPENSFFFDPESYLYFEKHSCSNSEGQNWRLTAFGSHPEIMKRIILLSADTEEGMLRVSDLASTTPEKYIARARQHLAAATLFENSHPSTDDLVISIDCDRLMKNCQSEPLNARPYHEELVRKFTETTGGQSVFTLRPTDRAEHAAALFYWRNILRETVRENARISPFWLNMNVSRLPDAM